MAYFHHLQPPKHRHKETMVVSTIIKYLKTDGGLHYLGMPQGSS